MGNHQNIFLRPLLGLPHVIPLPPPLWHPPGAILWRRYYNTIAKAQEDLGRQALSLQKQVLYILLKTQGFPLKLHNSSNFKKHQSRYCDDLHRPEGKPTRRVNPLKTPLASPVAKASRIFTIFHGWGENHSLSCPFYHAIFFKPG
jgi:hypothetical protein